MPAKEGFYLTSNRDESLSREKVDWPYQKDFPEYKIYYPKDNQGNGTWIAADNRNNVVCLLNGAIKPHIRREKYKKSRGLIVLDVFSYDSTRDFKQFYDLEEIEPFTLVIILNGSISEFKWDGAYKYLSEYSMDKPRIWSSVTLYDPQVTKLRETWFDQWLLKTSDINRDEIFSFHKSENSDQPEYNIKMKRKMVQTLSITSVYATAGETSVIYTDLTNETSSELIIKS